MTPNKEERMKLFNMIIEGVFDRETHKIYKPEEIETITIANNPLRILPEIKNGGVLENAEIWLKPEATNDTK